MLLIKRRFSQPLVPASHPRPPVSQRWSPSTSGSQRNHGRSHAASAPDAASRGAGASQHRDTGRPASPSCAPQLGPARRRGSARGGGGYQPARPRRHHPLPGTGGPSAPCGADLPGARAPGHRGAASFRRRVSAGVGRRARPLRVGRGSERRARHDGRPAAFRGLAVAAQCGRVAHVGRAAEILLAVRAVLRHQRQRRRELPFLLRHPRRDPAEYLGRRGDRSHGKHAAHSVWPRTGALAAAGDPKPNAPSPSPEARSPRGACVRPRRARPLGLSRVLCVQPLLPSPL